VLILFTFHVVFHCFAYALYECNILFDVWGKGSLILHVVCRSAVCSSCRSRTKIVFPDTLDGENAHQQAMSTPLTPHARLKKINLNSQKMKVVQMVTVYCQLFHNTGVLERDLKNKQEIGL